MRERDLRFFTVVGVIVAFVIVESVSFKQGFTQDWVFVCFYMSACLFAAWYRAWFAAATALSVALVRGMVAVHLTGRVFEIASIVFAAMFFLLIAVYVRQRDRILQLTRERSDL